MHHLLALLLFVPSLCLAQLPDYVPTNGIVAYYPLDGNLTNAVDSSSFNGISFNGNYISNRNNQPTSAAGLPGSQLIQLPLNPAILSNEFTVAFWVYTRSNSIHNEIQIGAPNGPARANFGLSSNDRRPYISEMSCSGTYGDCGNSSTQPTPLNSWFHLSYALNGDSTKFFINGSETGINQSCTIDLDCTDATMAFWFGGDVTGGAIEYFNGDYDDIGIWNRALDSAEVMALYIGTPPDYGCTDSTACNFDEEANEDDGSCIVDFSISNLNGTNDLQVCPGEEVILNLQSAAITGTAGCAVNPFIIFDDSIYKQDTIFSIAVRFTLNQSDLGQNIYRQISDGEVNLGYSPTNGLSFNTKASYGNCYTASGWVNVSTPIEEGIQYSVVATYQRGESIRLFVDGELKATSSVNDGLLADCNLYPAEIGKDSDNALTIDEIGFYNSMLNDSSISDYTGCVIQSNLFGDALTLLEFNSNEIETSGTSDIIIASATIDSIESSCSCGHPAFNQALWSTGLSSSSLTWSAATDSAIISVILPDYASCTDTIAITLYDATACADPLACNFDSSAFCSLNCTYPPFGLDNCITGASLCGENTIWSSTLQECVGVIQTPDSIVVLIPSCGPGTVWDPVNEECIIAIPADLNYDGCVTTSDLLDLLTWHGTCPPNPDGSGGPVEPAWTCGDPVNYSGYGYGTIEIGSQCWFSDNVRTLPELSPPSEGSEQDGLPHAYIPGFYGNDILEGLNLPAYELYGVLYNYAAVEQWELCPIGWHIPSPSEWNLLVAYAGGGIAGSNLKNSDNDVPAWNGTNIYGFSATPSGEREVNGSFILINNRASFWASQPYWGRYISGDGVNEFSYYPPSRGLSVRCVKD